VNAIYEKRNLRLPVRPGFSKLWEFPLQHPKVYSCCNFCLWCTVSSPQCTTLPTSSLREGDICCYPTPTCHKLPHNRPDSTWQFSSGPFLPCGPFTTYVRHCFPNNCEKFLSINYIFDLCEIIRMFQHQTFVAYSWNRTITWRDRVILKWIWNKENLRGARHLAKDRWWYLLKMKIELWIQQIDGNFLTRWETFRFSRTQLHGIF